MLEASGVKKESVKGIGFDATCSLAVLKQEGGESVSVAGPEFTDSARNVICMFAGPFMNCAGGGF